MGYLEEPGAKPELPLLPELAEEIIGEQAPGIPVVLTQGPAANNADATICSSNHTRCPCRRMQESIDLNLVQVMESIIVDNDDLVTRVQPLLAFATSSNPNILNLKQAMKAPDSKQFWKAMKQEFNSHTNQKHWVFVLRSSLLWGTKVLLPVWAMHRKHRIATGLVYK